MAQTKVKTKGIADTNVTNAKLGTDISAAKLTAGTVATARLGSGTASSSTYLAGDQTIKHFQNMTIIKSNRISPC